MSRLFNRLPIRRRSPRYAGYSAVSRADEHPAHGPLCAAISGRVPRSLVRLSCLILHRNPGYEVQILRFVHRERQVPLRARRMGTSDPFEPGRRVYFRTDLVSTLRWPPGIF